MDPFSRKKAMKGGPQQESALAESKGNEKEKQKKKKKPMKPSTIAFRQQHLRAWQPILTPRNVLPTLFLLALLCAPIAGVLVWGSNKVTTFELDYTECDTRSSTLEDMPKGKWDYLLAAGKSEKGIKPPQWSYAEDGSAAFDRQRVCTIEFDVPYDLPPSVFLYYKLTNYFQNHRRYVKSVDTAQLHGDAVSASSLDGGDCKPITSSPDGRPYYPCGLIANSYYNDSYSALSSLSSDPTYTFSEKGIIWSKEKKKYSARPDYASPQDVSPPPNWKEKYPQGYVDGFPNFQEDEHFQVWMRIAGLATFRKLWGRNDADGLRAGRWRIEAFMNYPVKSFSGTKSIVISTASWSGGRQSFLGWSYVALAVFCMLCAVAGTARHLWKPRRLGDMSLLSWNQPKSPHQ